MKINVQSPFTLTRDDGERVTFRQGIQEVEQKIADHWFTKAHSEPVDSPKQDESKQDESKQDESKQDESKQGASKSGTTTTKAKTEG